MKIAKKAACIGLVLSLICGFLAGCKSPANRVLMSQEEYGEKMWEAKTTPFGAYPETVTYTLGKMTSTNRSNMPEGDTYEDNAYTRYIREVLNVQNDNVFEATDKQYDTNVSMAIAMETLPDIMLVSNYEDLETLIENDMIEDLTASYESCISQRIREMYESYGEGMIDSVTFDGRIMALPETNITDGPNLVWLRKDWIDELGLAEPKTIDDVTEIVRQFLANKMGGEGTVGLVCDTEIAGECGYSSEYLLDIVFAAFGAYPKQWIYDENGDIVYGSVTEQSKEALAAVRSLYEEGIIEKDFLVHTSANIIELIEQGKCGSFFGPWWAANNPLAAAVQKAAERGENADWQPYLIATDTDGAASYHSQNPAYKYVVVRKGYEHPEIAAKIISVMFDKIRYECDESKEFEEYYQLNVEPTARPLAINVDYNNALELCYEDICAVLEGRKQEDSLELLEKSYYEACRSYLNNPKEADSEAWAAYMTRIKACSAICGGNVKIVPSLFFGTTKTMKSEWWKLKEKEKESYLKIICGEEPLDYFDTFTVFWYENGGTQITEEVREKIYG